MQNKFEQFLQGKYGKELTERLVKHNRLDVTSIQYSSDENLEDQELVKKQLANLKSQLNLTFEIDNHKWAFDFSGWIGELDFSKPSVRKFMVVGLEPHIERFDFQITYGLSDTAPVSNEKRFSIDNNKANFIRCKEDSSLIWTNLFKLLANEVDQRSVQEEENEQTLEGFLQQFYITDLCHFAPRGKANTIHKVPNWKKNRFKVADHFLKNEIEIINPKVIIAQGTGVFGNLVRCLGIKSFEAHLFNVGNKTFQIKVGHFNNSKIISVPHIGSSMIHKTFWKRNLKTVRDTLDFKGLV